MTTFLSLPALSRLMVTGRDRGKYLHNFCTNNIKELPDGKACEAFFCDVKARVIAHGYVLAFDDCHEIWMLGGDEAGLLKHLNRYIITEDVTISSVTESTSAIAAIDATSADRVRFGGTDAGLALQEPLSCARLPFEGLDGALISPAALSVSWAGTLMLWIAARKNCPPMPLPKDRAAAESVFELLRIRERFPIINQDLSIDNMVPEAERNSSAISYVKGCYLGQEPIARLDAMGHVNRALRCVKSAASAVHLLGANILTADGTPAGVVTSAASIDGGSIGLAMIRTNAVESPLNCMLDGQNVEIRIEKA